MLKDGQQNSCKDTLFLVELSYKEFTHPIEQIYLLVNSTELSTFISQLFVVKDGAEFVVTYVP